MAGTHEFTARADAAFSSWVWDGRTLRLSTDAFGLVPMFVYRGPGVVAVSTSVERLAAEAPSLRYDWPALSVFLRLGFFIAEDTPFLEIRALPPGATLAFRDGIWTGGGALPIVDASRVSRPAAVGESIRLAERAIDRRVPDDTFVLPLSGGRDSRHILLALLKRGCQPERVITTPRYPPTPNEDPRVASLLADAVCVPHSLPRASYPPSAAEARKNVASGYCADEHAWFYPMLDELRQDARLVYEGIGGSLWTTGWLPEQRWRTLWSSGPFAAVAAAMLDRYSIVTDPVVDRTLCGSERCSREVAIERLVPELARHAHAPDPGKSFHFWNRLRRELAIVPNDWMRQRAKVRTPLVDHDLAAFLLSLDPAVVSPALSRADRSFHDEAIHLSYPMYRDVPFECDDAPVRDASKHHAALTRDVAAYLLSRPGAFSLVRFDRVVPRLLRALVDDQYAASIPWLATMTLYLAQLADAATAEPARHINAADATSSRLPASPTGLLQPALPPAS